MTDVIMLLVEQIVSNGISEGIAWRKDRDDERKRKEFVREGLTQILQDEQNNPYFNSLTLILEESKLLQDVYKGYGVGTPVPNVEERLNGEFSRNHISLADQPSIRGVINKMRDCMNTIMLLPASGEEARLSYLMEETASKLAASMGEHAPPAPAQSVTLSPSDLEARSEPVPEIPHMIARRLVANDASDDVQPISMSAFLQANNRLAIVNDAGAGKTYALYQLYAQAKREGYRCAYLSLKKYPGIPLLDQLQTQLLMDPQSVVLILDGYDEIKAEHFSHFVATIDRISSRIHDMRMVLSSRANFFVHYPVKPFAVYRLAGITDQERRQYVITRGIDHDQFFREVRQRNLTALCENTFYFSELVQLWQKNQMLPDEADIMDAIIDGRMKSDREKFRLAAPALAEQTGAMRRLLERIAFIMQCTHHVQLTEEEMGRLCTPEERGQLALQGIWENDTAGGWCFSHNNFREYLAACWLKKRPLNEIVQYISWPTDRPAVKPSWMNVLAYMAKMKGNRDLQDWIAQNDPGVITLFEKDRFSADERFCLFKRVYEQYEDAEAWAELDHHALKRMGAFASSSGAVQYILDKLTKKLPIRQQKNLLRILVFFDSLYEHADDCRLVIGGIAFENGYPDHVRVDALDVMRAFPQVFAGYVDTAAARCMVSDNEEYRYRLYRFIDAAGQIDAHFDVILHELELAMDERGTHDFSRAIFLERLCSTTQNPTTVLQLLSFVAEHPQYINRKPFEKAWRNLLDVAICNHETDGKRFDDAILKLFDEAHIRFSAEVTAQIKRYMEKTRTEAVFLDHILTHPNIVLSYALAGLACPSFIDLLIDEYQNDRLPEPDAVELLIKQLSPDDESRHKLIRAVFMKKGTVVDPPEHIDYETVQRRGHQIYFDALFSRERFAALVRELIELQGEGTPVHELHDIACQPQDKDIALADCECALRKTFPKNVHVTLGAAVDKIKNWEEFQYCHACDILAQCQYLSPSVEQRTWLEQTTLAKISGIDVRKIAKDFFEKKQYNSSLHRALKTMARLNMACEKDVLKSFLMIPSWLFGEIDPSSFPAYLLQQLSEANMSAQVLYNIEHETLHEDVAAAHLNYCTAHKLHGAKAFAIQFLFSEESQGYRHLALKYLSDMCGMEVIVDEVLPRCQDDDLLREIANYIPLHIPVPLLDEKLAVAYERNPSEAWQTLMIKRNHRRALEKYYADAQRLKTIPDMPQNNELPSLTEAIGDVDDVALLDIILGLLRLRNQPGFVDMEFWGLRHSCWQAIMGMADTHEEEVRKALEKERDAASGDHRLTCIDLMKSIEQRNREYMDQGISFEMALALTAS